MTFALTQKGRNVLETVTAALGLLITTLISVADKLPGDWGIGMMIIGPIAAYGITDALTIEKGGQLTATVVVPQIQTSYASVKPTIDAQVAKITNPTERALVADSLALIEQQIAKLSP